MAPSETTTRVLVALVGIPIVVGAAYAGGWVLTGILVVLSVLAALEFYRLAETKQVRPLSTAGAIVSGLFVVLAGLRPEAGPDGAHFGSLLVVAALGVAASVIWLRGTSGQPLLATTATLWGALYTGGLLSFAIFLRHLPQHDGTWHAMALLFAPIVLTWVSDTAAYFVGRAWGRRRLIPSVSPGKTVEGAIGAVVGAAVVAIAYGRLLAQFPTYNLGWMEAAFFGVLVSVAAQVGDLVESLFKRDAGVKDSGRLLPGHGGALDRFDSLFFTLPLGYFFLRFVVGAPQPF